MTKDEQQGRDAGKEGGLVYLEGVVLFGFRTPCVGEKMARERMGVRFVLGGRLVWVSHSVFWPLLPTLLFCPDAVRLLRDMKECTGATTSAATAAEAIAAVAVAVVASSANITTTTTITYHRYRRCHRHRHRHHQRLV